MVGIFSYINSIFSCSQVLYKKSCLEKIGKVYRRTPIAVPLLIKDPGTAAFLITLQIFSEEVPCRTLLDDCFHLLEYTNKIIVAYSEHCQISKMQRFAKTKSLELFYQNVPSEIVDNVLNTPLDKILCF